MINTAEVIIAVKQNNACNNACEIIQVLEGKITLKYGSYYQYNSKL
jgi:hypothetical protein